MVINTKGCFVCGSKPAVFWAFPDFNNPKANIFPHKSVTGRCEDCHPTWLENWVDLCGEGAVIVLSNYDEAVAIDAVIEIAES